MAKLNRLLGLLLAALSAPALAADPTLMAAYGFEEGTGVTVLDVSGNSNTGSISGASWTAAGKNGSALSFDGVNDRVFVASSSSLNVTTALTVEAWVFPTAAQGGWRTVVQKEVDAYLLHASSNAGALRPAAGGTYAGAVSSFSAPSAIAVNAWTHLAQTYDGSIVRMYVNGVQVASAAHSGALETNNNPLSIGGTAAYGEYFLGRIDDVRVYSRVLSAAEIQTDMSTAVGGTPPPPDTQAPSAPSGLSAIAVSSTQISLSWTAATDNVGVTNYLIERCTGAGCSNFGQIATTGGTTFNNTTLLASTSYSYRVRATDAAGNQSGYSNTASATTPSVADTQAPSAPSGLSATAVSTTQINLSWTAATDNVGVTNYLIERCTGAGCTNFGQIATASGTTFNNTTLLAATTYRYRVRATDAAGNQGGYSNIASGATQSVPDTQAPSAPSGLSATAVSSTQINLSWTAATDDVGVTNYLIERCIGAGCSNFSQIATASGTTFNNTTLLASTSYSYRVRATDAAGNQGGYSNTASATTLAGGGGVAGLMAAYGFEEGTGVTVLDVSGNSNTGSISGASWTAAGKNGSALSFDGVNDRVFVASSSSLNVTTALTVEAWVFPTAAQGGWRTVVQKEVDAYLLHASSNAGALRPAAGGTYAGAVSSFSAPSAIAVNAWTHLAQTYDGSIVRMYVNGVQVASAAHSGALETNNNPLSIGGTAAYGEYFLGRIDDVRVYSRVLSAAEIQTDMSTAVGGTPPPPDTQAPSAPSGLSAIAVSSTQISLSWTAATDNVGVTNYLIERCIGAGCSNFGQIATTGGTTFNNTTLLASTSYSYRVRATDAAGNQGGYSNTASATTPSVADTQAPSAPSGLSATAVSTTQINLSWTAATDNVGVTNYLIERCTGAGCTNFGQIATASGTTFNNTTLLAATTYRYRVRATDAAGNQGGYSNIASGATQSVPDTQAPSAPSGLSATAVSSTQINLSWTAATDDVGVTNYLIERCIGAGCSNFSQIATASGTTFNNTTLLASTSYSYRVRATDAAGNQGGYSNTASATTLAGGGGVAGLMAAYGFEEGTGVTVLDVSGNSNTGSISGASWTAAGKNGSALSFDGVNDRVFVASSSSLNVTTALTVEAWVFPTAAQGGWRTVVQKEVDAYLLHASSNAGALRPAAGGTYAGAVSSFSAPSAIAVNAWTHLAQTYDGSIVRMYVNGVQVASAAHSGALETNNNPLSIGGTAAYGEYFLGRIDDVRVYSRVLSAAEIQTDMSTAVGGTPPPPDTQAPSAPSGLSAIAVSSTQINLSWTAATDNVGVTNYLIERCIGAGCSNFSQIATTGGTTFNNTTLLASTSYSYRVRATDAAGNQSGYSNSASATTLAGGQLTATVVNPLEGSTQAGTIALSAVASGDNVAGVRFQVDGVDIGPADTVAPYTQNLNTGGFANGTHTITARTWDTVGNSATSAGVSVAFSNASPGNPAATGLWLGTINWPLSAVHAHLLPDRRVLVSDAQSFAGTDAKVWDPATDRFVNATALDNIFCAGHAALPDGRLLVVGGHVTAHVGIADANIFNPQTNSWSAAATMQFARWYPTLTPLPDGRMLVQSGESNCNGCEVATPEIYNPANNTWTSLSTAAQYFPYYPHTYVLPDGRVLVASTTRAMIQSKVLNLTTQTWSNIGGAPVDGATSVMYQPGKVLKVGTSTDADAAVRAAAATAYVLDANQGGATWRAVASMSAPRAYPTATMLPDGRVLITGGGRTTDAVGLSGSNPVLPAESWSPDTETWTPLASLHSPRLYHSTAMLLPDGRILVTGGGRFYGSPDPTDQLNAEIFVPPYLFRGPRPVITSAPAQLSYAQPFTVGTPDAARIVKAVLIRPASVTHNIDMNQAFVPVSFTVNGNTLDITAPANANIAPPGYYMLFLVDDQGVPSIAAFVRL